MRSYKLFVFGLPIAHLLLIAVMAARVCRSAEPLQTAERAAAVDFASDVFPILQRSCLECHGPEREEGGLRLDQPEALLASGALEPGEPEASELLRRVELPPGDSDIMPAVGEPLGRDNIETLRRWIEQGADWPADFQPGRHWAYVRPQRPALPHVEDATWIQSPIDHFVLHRLQQQGLTPSEPAQPEKLVRRLFLDLIGLPPAPEEVKAFAKDPSAERYERLVDDLLARPQFGERWARPWLDLARYADSHGFQRDDLRDIWAYRDWVIRALNADMPFDQFTIEQLAGDLLPDASEAQKIATGFHRCAPTNVEAGSLPEETRIEQVIDRVNTTGAVWLGTTLECCQCHDHKYDPFTARDYYGMLAYFNSTEREADRSDPKTPSSIRFQGPTMPLSVPERDARRAALVAEQQELESQRHARRKELEANLAEWAHDLQARLADAPREHALQVIDFHSEGTTDGFRIEDDGSILLTGGDPPEKDVYHLRARSPVSEGIRAIQLDALRHESLPGGGPGRGDPQRRNFVLHDFRAELVSSDGSAASKLEFARAEASFSQQNWDVAGAIDEDPKSGWAISPQFDRSHWARFVLSRPLEIPPDGELHFTLSQQFGRARTLGCIRVSVITGDPDIESVPEELLVISRQPPEEWTAKQRRRLLDYRLEQDRPAQRLKKQISRLETQITELKPDTTLVMLELDEPRPAHIFQRGDYSQPGEAVVPTTPVVLHPPQGPPNRLGLARWLVAPENPLVARVTVNRWWAELFGQGLVTTVEDFGIKGDAPSHPHLLDWLAVEFTEQDWSMKHILKTIVLSATYQQSSYASKKALERDDRNRWLSRGPALRMEAEMIRDNALAIAGLIDLKPFGPPIRPYQPDGIWNKVGGEKYDYQVSPGSERHRRGIYVVLKRGAPYPSFVNFDGSARLACVVKRSRTNTPLQALTLLNDPVYVEAAEGLAQRIRQFGAPLNSERASTEASPEVADEVVKRIDYGFRLCVARPPEPRELELLTQLFWEQYQASDQEHPGTSEVERAAWYSVATTLLNLHETITKD